MKIEFVVWLTRELEKRGWSNSELARRAGLVPSAISQVINGTRDPGDTLCRKVATAFGVPEEKVMRRAGRLSPLPGPEDDVILKEIYEIAGRLAPAERRELHEYALWRHSRQGEDDE